MSFASRNMMNDGCDILGRPLKVGQKVARPHTYGRAACLDLRTVSKVQDGKVWLDGASAKPLQYSGRVVILEDVA